MRATLALTLALAASAAQAAGPAASGDSHAGPGKSEAPRIRPVSPPESVNAFPAEIVDRMRERLVALDGEPAAATTPHKPFPAPPETPASEAPGGR